MNRKADITIARNAITAFCKATGIKGKYAKGYFIIDQFDRKLHLKVVAQGLDKAAIGILKQEYDIDECIIAARHVYPAQAQLLRHLGIPFIDTAGNAYINRYSLFVYIEGRQPVGEATAKPVRAFKKTGLKVIFAFLCNPGLENRTYRDIAGNAGVALGAVGRIMTELEEKGFLRKQGRKGFQLREKEELLKRWVTAYPEQLKPGLIVGRYIFPEIRVYVAEKEIKGTNALWSGEIAAEKLTGYLTAKNAVIYTDGDIEELALKLRLQKNTDGNAVILRKFWNFDYKNNIHTVPLILVYADLLATGLERNIEAAGKIYDTEIKKLLT